MIAVAEQIPTGTWQVDKVHSTIGFAVRHMVVSTFRGRFDDYDASLTVEEGQLRLVGTVRVDSAQVKDENLAAHLLSPEFFDAERTPEIRFESDAFRSEGEQVVVDGRLTIKGTTRPVEARGTVTPALEDPYGGTRLGLQLETAIDRSEFGLNWNQPLPKGGFALSNEVKLIVDLELTKAA